MTLSNPTVAIALVTICSQNHKEPGSVEQYPTSGDNQVAQVLAQAVQACTNGNPVNVDVITSTQIADNLKQYISQGVQKIIVVPNTLIRTLETEQELANLVTTLQEEHPQIDLVYTPPPFSIEHQAKLIFNNVREHLPKQLAATTEHLNALPAGAKAVVVKLVGGHDMLSRMATLGFTPGVQVSVVQNFGHGPLIVSIRNTRIALGRGEAGKIRVRQLGKPRSAFHCRRRRQNWAWVNSAFNLALREGSKYYHRHKQQRHSKG